MPVSATLDTAPASKVSPRGWLAALLAVVFAPFAFLYLHRAQRALGYVVALAVPFLIALYALTHGWSSVAGIALLLVLAVAAHGVYDAWRCASQPPLRRSPPAYVIIAVGSAALFFLGAARGFLGEPYKIPSSSMAPLLQRGDLVVVSKWGYGNYGTDKLPVHGKRFRAPRRGDIVVFKWPNDPNVDYVKRVIGLPGDVISYRNKHLNVNGVAAHYAALGSYQPVNPGATMQRASETLADSSRDVLTDPLAPVIVSSSVTPSALQHCAHDAGGVRCTVPPEHYFMLGDNRDASNDSRYWGMVPAENLIGRVVWHTQLFRKRN